MRNEYDSSRGLDIFSKAARYFYLDEERPSLTEEATHRLQQVFEYIRNNPEVAVERLEQLDRAIKRFNNYHDRGSFPQDAINATNISRMLKVMPEVERLPEIQHSYLPENPTAFFKTFALRIHRGHYTFIENVTDSSKIREHIITAALLDGYGLAMKMEWIAKEGIAVDADSIVNALCEMALAGSLRDEIYEIGWFDEKWGFSPDFTAGIQAKYASQTP